MVTSVLCAVSGDIIHPPQLHWLLILRCCRSAIDDFRQTMLAKQYGCDWVGSFVAVPFELQRRILPDAKESFDRQLDAIG